MALDLISKKKAHRNILFCQCAGLLAPQFLMNGFILNYLKKYDFQDGVIMLILTLIPSLGNLIFLMPSGYISDKIGKKKLGLLGNYLQAIGFASFSLVYFIPSYAAFWAVSAVVLFSLGLALFVSSWFALLDPLIDMDSRGRFFANLRIAWQVIAFVATLLVSFVLSGYNSSKTYVIIIAIITFFMLLRIFYYHKIPDLSVTIEKVESFKESLKGLFANSNYISFCWFIFLYMFFGGSVLTFLNLYEKESLLFSESDVISMGYSGQLGALAGYWLGAKWADKAKLVWLFRGNALLSALSMTLFAILLKDMTSLVIYSGLLTFLFSLYFNSMGIGITTEAMWQVKIKNRSVGISFSMTMLAAGAALSSLVSSLYLTYCKDIKFEIVGRSFNHYQSYLLISAFGLLSVVAYYSLKRNRTI